VDLTGSSQGFRPPPARLLGALLALTVATRLALVFYLRTWLGDAGAYEHDQIARSLVAGEGFRFSFFSNSPLPSSHQAPGVSFLLAAGYALFGSDSPAGRMAVECVNVVMAIAAAGSLGWIALRWWGVRAMTLAMLGYALFPAFVYMPTRIQAVNWSVTFLLVFLACFIALSDRPRSWRLAIATGAAGALGALGEPILVAPFGWCWLWLGWERRSIRLSAIVLVVFAIVLAPWLTRNAMVHNRITFVKSTFWYVFWQGNHAGASGTDKLQVSADIQRQLGWSTGMGRESEALLTAAREQAVSVNVTLSESDLRELHALASEVEKVRWFEQRVRLWLPEHWAHYARISARRLGMLLWFDDTNPRSLMLPYRLPYLVLFGLAIAGLVLIARDRPHRSGFAFWVVALGSLFFVHTLIITSARFRLPIEALYLLPGAFAVDRLIDRVSGNAQGTRGHPPRHCQKSPS
jgi:4-amino-4-deoxy-L-arabinose transferase-like glycosyltransferase